MLHRLWRKPANSPPKRYNPSGQPSIAIPDDDDLSEDLIQRALACIRLGDVRTDFLDAFSRVVSGLELPPHIRVLRLRLPGWFWLLHPLLGLQLVILQRILRNASQLETRGSVYVALADRCRSLLDAIEPGRDMPTRVGQTARQFVGRRSCSFRQLRDTVITGAGIVTSCFQQGVELLRSNKLLAAVLGTGLVFIVFAVLIAAYGIFHFYRCASVDCVFIGAIQLSLIGFTLGLMPVHHCWTKIRRYKGIHARST